MSSRGRAKSKSRDEALAASGTQRSLAETERLTARRARQAVACIMNASRHQGKGDENLSRAIGAVILVTVAALMDRSEGVGRGNHLLPVIVDWVRGQPVLAEGLAGPGLKLLDAISHSEEVARLLISLHDLVLEARETHGEWSAFRLPGVIYEASLGWEKVNSGLRKTSRLIKAKGAVYTPRPVVRFIVEKTLRPLLSSCEDLDALHSLTVCDPACGGGAFLLEAMRLLEEEALDRGWLGRERAERMEWRRLIAAESLSGVDIDPSAAQIARLTLWAASGSGDDEANTLSRSVLRGDALVGAWKSDLNGSGNGEDEPSKLMRAMDAWCDKLLPEGLDAPPLHWELAFPERFPPTESGPRGWSAVVGNPPYVKARELGLRASYLMARFPESYTGYNDLSAFFFHRGLEILKPEGRLGYIAPAYWFQNTYGEKLRRFLLSQGRLEEVYDFGPDQVFPGRGVHTAVVILSREPGEERNGSGQVRYQRLSPDKLDMATDETGKAVLVPRRSMGSGKWVFASAEVDLILQKAFKNGRPLGELFYIEKGPSSGKNGVFTLDSKELINHNIEADLIRPCIKNGEVLRYGPLTPKRWLLYLDGPVDLDYYPKAAAYLEAHRKALASRNEARRNLYPWWRLERPRRRALFEAPAKLVVPYRASENRFTLDEGGCFNDGGDIRVLVPREGVGRQVMLAALAVANSALGNLVYRHIGKPKGRILEYFVKPLASAPFGTPNNGWEEGDEAALTAWLKEEGPEGLVGQIQRLRRGSALMTPALALLAERMLELHREGEAGDYVLATDKAIDRLVAMLFGLTSGEESLVKEYSVADR